TRSPVVVEIASGDYRLDEPLDLDDSDGGTESAPVIWRPRQGEEVRLHPGALLDGFQRVDDEATLQRLPEQATSS
ncbi:MAG: hypothetical protein VX528_09710, partial [Candidatus Latescibacterota bacterium]|nr:hypothetical protein [Candidatus Latescibacterota bacterium]